MKIEWSRYIENDCFHDYHANYGSNCPLAKSFYCPADKTLELRFKHGQGVKFAVKDRAHAEQIIRAIEGEE